MHYHEHHNSTLLEPKKVHQDSQPRSQTQHHYDEHSLGIQQYKSYIMDQGDEPNKHTHIFEMHVIPEEESDQEQEDNNLSSQPSDPVGAINKSGLDHKVHHTDESTTE